MLENRSFKKQPEIPLHDVNVYLQRMRCSMLDKLFFLDKVFVPYTHLLDFGCADGSLIKMTQLFCPACHFAGYDTSAEMLARARDNVPKAAFYRDWESIRLPNDQTLLNLSSVIHEVYSYGTEKDVSLFWDRVFGSGFRVVALRDMMLTEADAKAPVREELLQTVRRSLFCRAQLESFEHIWGNIQTRGELIHFLLKYKYTENWEREVRENYFPLTVEQFMERIPEDYRITYMQHAALPYLTRQIERDFGFRPTAPTHIKLIAEKR